MPSGQPVTQKNKLKIMQLFSTEVSDIDKYLCLEDCARKCSKRYKENIGYWAVRDWSRKDDALGKLYSMGLVSRAESYCRIANTVIKSVEEFWTDNKGNLKERAQACNKARLQLDHYRWLMSKLSPELYGDFYYEMRKLEEGMKLLQKQIDDLTKKNGKG